MPLHGLDAQNHNWHFLTSFFAQDFPFKAKFSGFLCTGQLVHGCRHTEPNLPFPHLLPSRQMTAAVNPLASLSTCIHLWWKRQNALPSCKGHYLCLCIRCFPGIQNPGQYQHCLLPPRSEFLHKTVCKNNYSTYVKLINCKNRPLIVCSSKYFRYSSPGSNDFKWLFHKILGTSLWRDNNGTGRNFLQSGCDEIRLWLWPCKAHCVLLNLTSQPHTMAPFKGQNLCNSKN